MIEPRAPAGGTDLRQAQVHISTKFSAHHRLRVDISKIQFFSCFRCNRSLPESSFVPIHYLRNATYLHPLCHTCRLQRRLGFDGHPLYSPALHRFATQLVSGRKSQSRVRGIVFALEADDVVSMYIAQGGRCALSDVLMTYEHGTRSKRNLTALSVDRINSERNYTIDNCHLTCGIVNIMKHEMAVEEFGEWCARVALHLAATTRKAA